jgi:hypothetical protein
MDFPLYNGRFGIFNASQWLNYNSYVKLSDIIGKYANLYISNSFSALQYFNAGIYTTSLNGISSHVLEYLSNITSDVQEQLTTVLTRTWNMTFDLSKDTTKVSGSLFTKDTAASRLASTNITTQCINCQKLQTNSIKSKTITATSIQCQTLTSNTDIGAYFFVNVAMYPLCKSQSFSPFAGDNVMWCHVKMNYKVDCLDERGIILCSTENTTDDFIYNIPIPSSVVRINLYLHGRILR